MCMLISSRLYLELDAAQAPPGAWALRDQCRQRIWLQTRHGFVFIVKEMELADKGCMSLP